MIIKTDTPLDQLPVTDGKAAEAGKIEEIHDFKGPGVMKELTRELKPGTYVLICNVPTHYQQGVRAAFTVQ